LRGKTGIGLLVSSNPRPWLWGRVAVCRIPALPQAWVPSQEFFVGLGGRPDTLERQVREPLVGLPGQNPLSDVSRKSYYSSLETHRIRRPTARACLVCP
jgi:hypothetical protein